MFVFRPYMMDRFLISIFLDIPIEDLIENNNLTGLDQTSTDQIFFGLKIGYILIF